MMRTGLAIGVTVGALVFSGLMVATGSATAADRHGTTELAGHHENVEPSGHFELDGHFEGSSLPAGISGHVDGG
jgi:hypothetical protein